MGKKILAVIAIIWGSLILVNYFFGNQPTSSNAAYQGGSLAAVGIGFLMVVLGIGTFLKKKDPEAK